MEEVAKVTFAKDRSFPKNRRLLKRTEFVRVQKGGSAAGSRNYVVIALPQADLGAPTRLGLVASRKTGNAVARNRGKRIVREWFRLGYQGHRGMDIVVILRSGAPSLGLDEASRELDSGLRRAIQKAGRR